MSLHICKGGLSALIRNRSEDFWADFHGFDAGGRDRVEGVGELPGAVADQEPETRGAVAEVHQEDIIAAVLLPLGTWLAELPAGTTASMSPASTPSASFTTADVAFATGMLRLEDQSTAMAAPVAGHTSNAALPVRRPPAWPRQRHPAHARPGGRMAPGRPGATASGGMGPGMMGTRDWGEMTHQHGRGFNGHWLVAMIANHAAEITLCRAELRSGTARKPGPSLAPCSRDGWPNSPSCSVGTTTTSTTARITEPAACSGPETSAAPVT